MTTRRYDVLSPHIREWVEKGVLSEESACRLQGVEQVLGEVFVAQGRPITAAEWARFELGRPERDIRAFESDKGTVAFLDKTKVPATGHEELRVILGERGGRYDELRLRYSNKGMVGLHGDQTDLWRNLKHGWSHFGILRDDVPGSLVRRQDLITWEGTPSVDERAFGAQLSETDRQSIAQIHATVHKCAVPTS